MKTLNHKVEYLTKLVDKLLIFSKRWNDVSVSHVGDYIYVQWYKPKNDNPNVMQFDEKEIPVDDIDTAIGHYQNKLRHQLKLRNNDK